MKIRKATKEDYDKIIAIYDFAIDFMRKNKNDVQWQDKKLLKNSIIDDINNEQCFVCINDSQNISAVFCYFVGEEPTYKKIYNGNWLNDKTYGVIHRLAVSEQNKGIASYCIQWCINKCGNLKIDTHKDNIPMQKTILKNGFTYCGIIKKPDDTERLAYQICT